MKSAARIFLMISIFSTPSFSQSSHYSVLCNAIQQPIGTGVQQPGKSSISVTVDGRKVSGLTASTSVGQRRIVILQDISGSMKDGNAQKISWAIVEYFLASAPETDKLSLIDFNTDAYLDITLESRPVFSKQWDDLKAGKKLIGTGGTALFDAVLSATNHLKTNHPQEGDSLFIISDGNDNASRTNSRKLRDAVFASKIRVYWFVLASPPSRRSEVGGRSDLWDIVNGTGGGVIGTVPVNEMLLYAPLSGSVQPRFDVTPKSLSMIQPKVESLHKLIEQSQRIEFDLDSPLEKPAKITISGAAPNLQMLCPRFLLPN